MNIKSLFDLYRSKKIQNIISYLERVEKKAKKLKYGFKVNLSVSQDKNAMELNKLYGDILWGSKNSAANQEICKDEIEAFQQVFSINSNKESVLEVGCGSGRISQYLSKISNNLVVVEYSEDILNKCKENLAQVKSDIKFVKADFSSKVSNKKLGKFNTIILAENMLGMNLILEDRIQIIKNIEKHLLPNGIAVIGFRVDSNIEQPKFQYQAMDWTSSLNSISNHKIYGVVLNWSVGYFLKLLAMASNKLVISSIIAGYDRPAGGAMYHAIIKRIKE